MEILHIENLTFRYPKTEKNALDNVSLNINSGDFVVLCGKSGCGKTTLLKLLKKELSPAGEKSGKIIYNGILQSELEERKSACEIGYVLQNPDNQIVTDKVWHELAFGLENLGIPTEIIRRRVGEMASYFGIQNWFRSNTDELSGGQKQLLNLASVMVMQPKILILDEPTGQLDPIAAADFIATLKKLNQELGLTILLAEHRLEDVFPIADKVLLMDEGKVLLYDTPRNVGKRLGEIQEDHPMLSGLPSAMRIYNALNISDECPLTVREGRDFLERHFGNIKCDAKIAEYKHSEQIAVELRKVWFRYERDLPDVLRGVSFKVYKGEFFCILGGNGTGKTTTLNVISGLNKAYRGKILIDDVPIKSYKGNSLYRKKLAFLPQNPQTVFLKDNVKDDFNELLQALDIPKTEREEKIKHISLALDIADLLDKHPYDLSGGEQQKCALAKTLMLEPQILLLDEPTKGLDPASKKTLSNILKQLKSNGMTIVMVTHDVEFSAENADRCALFFDGEILSADVPKRFFAENNFYTTAANRIARRICPNAVTCEEVADAILGNKEE
ncbi:MAG: energy-coupling factor transporter ATPase [Faecalibacterium sp.]|nr:energy-coupling factor transporter ATPase [Ruminococcus sp.]MCM1391581.1 energy-coupling factor transporter ATPase [Ruminococcus sp.]MCM1485138.1 energy-coupling factor transporter ATPase [Faecalibacterium sp.]